MSLSAVDWHNLPPMTIKEVIGFCIAQVIVWGIAWYRYGTRGAEGDAR